MSGLEPAVLAAIIGGTAAIGAASISTFGAKSPSAPSVPNSIATPQRAAMVGESTKLKPGQKVNAINTSPQGLLGEATTSRGLLTGAK